MQMSPPPPVTPRPFRRSATDRVFGGVCGGLGQYWNVDPVILRVAFGVSLLFGGFGLFAYLALWLLVPDQSAPAGTRISDSWGLRILGAITAFIAVGIGLALLFGDANGGVLIGALVAGIVVWIAMSKRGPAPVVEAPPAGYAYGGTGGYETSELLPPPVPPRERSYLGLIGLCAAIAMAGVAMLITSNPTAIMASALLALAVTLLIGAFRGRARWLLILAVPLLVLVSASAQVQRADLSAGEVPWAPTEDMDTYSLSLGVLDVRFDEWIGQPDGDEVSVDVTVGDIRIAAPRNWEVRVIAQEGTATYVNGVKDDGIPNPDGTGRLIFVKPTKPKQGTITVNATARLGGVYIESNAPSAGTTVKKEKAA